ncbi:MAG: aspartate aminotransferase family protein [Oscillochloris sp.]|nr:aspartate aminotransferase family protein [Oscillochloris sp.]
MGHILQCHDIVKTDFVRGENCSLYDSRGRRYVDLESGIWSTALGHGHPRINRAIHVQLDQLTHLGTRYPHALAEATALDVLDIVGIDSGKCVFLSSGSEAVEFGVQVIRRVSNRPLLLTFAHAYLAAFGSAGQRRDDEWYVLDWDACADRDLDAVLREIPFERIGGFVFEPGGSGSGFVTFPPEPLVQALAQQVHLAGGLVLANEITTGMGRTGKWFGFQHYDLQPDVVALGKGLGNGYPVSAVAMRSAVAERAEQSGLRYAQSHQNDPLGCAVAREVIATMREEGWIERGAETGMYFLAGLRQLATQYDRVKGARGRGMLLALALYPDSRLTVQMVYEQLLEDGFLVGYYPAGNILRFDPALTIERADITALLGSLERIVAA